MTRVEPSEQVSLPTENAARPAAGGGPWILAGRRLSHNRSAMAAATLLAIIVAVTLLAPLYAHHVAHTDPFGSNLAGRTIVDGKHVDVLQQSGGLGLGVTPIGPTWDVHHYFLGADSEGRDVAARILYGGQASLLIAVGAALGSMLIASVLALVAGFFGGLVDTLLSRLMDILWAFPVFLLAILITTVSLTQGLRFGPISISTSGVVLPIVVIALIFVPFQYRPIRGQVLTVRERDFVKAAIVQGASARWLLWEEILPNVVNTLIVFLPLVMGINLLVESGLSFLGIGVQPPAASWGSIIGDSQNLLYTRPWVAMGPGIMIVLTVVGLNVLGDGVRDAFDPNVRRLVPAA
ncbi:MAG: peptide ABC transporter permease [Pseudonocardiales bacterium]|nr:MAG: peptide ABC transporter permease [Pseudonocardiales bacterium]